VYVFVDFPDDTDFIAQATGSSNLANQLGTIFTRSVSFLVNGHHRVDVVGFETLPNGVSKVRHKTFVGIESTGGTGFGAGDVNGDGNLTGRDVQPFIWHVTGFNPNFGPAADMNCDGLNDMSDIPDFAATLVQGP
jgi:hypothetical protein